MSDMTIVCPFCPLHCDDLTAASLLAGATGCSVADKRAKLIRKVPPMHEASVNHETCRLWVAEASRIVISGYVVDMETSRAISEFAAKTGAAVDVASTNPTASKLVARDGGFFTTLGELTSRKASVLIIGDPATHWPRIEERLRHVKAIVRWPESTSLLAQVAALRLNAAKRFSAASQIDDQLAAAIQLVNEAEYLVVLVAPLQESVSHSPIFWSSLLGLVRERNKVSRAAILSFDPSVTVRSVIAARNDPPPFLFPYDEASLCIEFSPFGERTTPSTGRKIVIGLTQQPLPSNQTCLPAGVPGVHHAGIVIRGDGSVTLPLQSWANQPALLSPASQLRSLLG